MAIAKNMVCLRYGQDAEAAARFFYAETFPDSRVNAVYPAPSDYPSGKAGDVLTVEFTITGIPCPGLNGGSAFKHDAVFSSQIATDDQQKTDRYWKTKDEWDISWKITPHVLTEALATGSNEAKRPSSCATTYPVPAERQARTRGTGGDNVRHQ